MALSNALGFEMNYSHPSEIMDEIARLTPTFHGVSYDKLDRLGSIQWPCNDEAPEGTPTMHIGSFVKGKGSFVVTEYVATEEKVNKRFPLLLTTGRILTQYNVGARLGVRTIPIGIKRTYLKFTLLMQKTEVLTMVRRCGWPAGRGK